MNGCLATEVVTDRGRNERRLLSVIGAEFGLAKQRRKRGVESMAGLGWTAQVTGVSLRDREDLRWRLSSLIASIEVDVSRRSFGNGNGDRRRFWCGTKRLSKIPTGGGWYDGGNIDNDGRVCGCIGLRFRVDLY
ncbi:hypothetical protein V6N13_081149 [Hibiscus sabdariffa]|uniref:Uncharacterized protein n=1 Tax=Hibiscus sabdariffa TaxID=183260 RepID=A0ABR2DBM1_9ROSI